MIPQQVTHFAAMLGMEPSEVASPEHAAHTLKQLIAAQVTLCDWAQVCAHVTPGDVQALRFSSMGEIDGYARDHAIDAQFYADVAAQAVFPDAERACALSPTFADFWHSTCPTMDHVKAAMLFHSLNLSNSRDVLDALASPIQGLLERRIIASAMDTFKHETLAGDDPAELAKEIGRLWSAVSFPATMFSGTRTGADPIAAPLPLADDDGADGASANYPMHLLASAAVEPAAGAQLHSEIRMHPALAQYRTHTLLPANFPIGKQLAQLFMPLDYLADNAATLTGKRQSSRTIASARAACGAQQGALLPIVMAQAPLAALASLLATPQAQSLYNAVCVKCGSEWARQNVTAPLLGTWLAAAHGAAAVSDARVQKAIAQYLAAAPVAPVEALAQVYLRV